MLQETISTRIPTEMLGELEKLAKEDQMDRSTEMRRLLEIGIRERKRRDVLERYRRSQITTERAAQELGISIWEMLEIMKKEKIEMQYDEEDLIRDLLIKK